MVRRGPYSKSKENKILILDALADSPQGLGWKELHKRVEHEIKSPTTFSNLLKELRWEYEIEKVGIDEKYRILEASLYKANSALKGAISKYVNERSKKESDPEKMLEALSKSIGGLSVYCAIQQIKTSRDWTRIASDYVSNDNYLLAFLKRYIINSGLELKGVEPTYPRLRELWSEGVNLMKEDHVFEAKLAELEFLAYDLYPSRLREIINELSKLEYEPEEVAGLVRGFKSKSDKM